MIDGRTGVKNMPDRAAAEDPEGRGDPEGCRGRAENVPV